MVIVRDNTLMISKGETLQTLFCLDRSGYELTGEELIKFNVKKTPSDDSIILQLTCGIDVLNNIVSVYATKEEISVLDVGIYYYDMLMTIRNARYTLMYPAQLIVREVCYE